MAEQEIQSKSKRDRSPSYPSISLKDAIERLVSLEDYFKRHPAPLSKVGLAWGMKASSSQSSSTIAALKSYGLVEYQGVGTDVKAVVTEDARTYLRAQQEPIKREILRRAALKPKAIEKYWSDWGLPRPIDAVCLDELALKGGFSQIGAENFLKVYDATIAYTDLSLSDKTYDKNRNEVNESDKKPTVEVGDLIQWASTGALKSDQPKRVRAIQERDGSDWIFVDGSNTGIPMNEVSIEQKGAKVAPPPPILSEEIKTLDSEREWLRGYLSKETSYRLIVSGDLGPKEIGKLIKLLQAQQSVLSDDD